MPRKNVPAAGEPALASRDPTNSAPLAKDTAQSPCSNQPTSAPVAAGTVSSRAKTFPALPALEAAGLSIGETNATSDLAHRAHRSRRSNAFRRLPRYHCLSRKLLRSPLYSHRPHPDHRWRILPDERLGLTFISATWSAACRVVSVIHGRQRPTASRGR